MDASAKIYGYRVDSLHSDTLKLAGGVGKTAQEAGITPEGGGGDGEQVCLLFLKQIFIVHSILDVQLFCAHPKESCIQKVVHQNMEKAL